jgi:hypothetical protein
MVQPPLTTIVANGFRHRMILSHNPATKALREVSVADQPLR